MRTPLHPAPDPSCILFFFDEVISYNINKLRLSAISNFHATEQFPLDYQKLLAFTLVLHYYAK